MERDARRLVRSIGSNPIEVATGRDNPSARVASKEHPDSRTRVTWKCFPDYKWAETGGLAIRGLLWDSFQSTGNPIGGVEFLITSVTRSVRCHGPQQIRAGVFQATAS